jgi:hypothetical protein
MRIRLALVLVAALPAVAFGQETCRPTSTRRRCRGCRRSTAQSSTPKGRRPSTPRHGADAGAGPGAVTVWSPRATEGLGVIGRALGVPRGDTFPLGPRLYQLIVLITAREIDQQYEWSAHEPPACASGSSSR